MQTKARIYACMYVCICVYTYTYIYLATSTIEHQAVIDIACGERFSLLLDEEVN